jgi:hypothetical protein
MFNPTYLYVKTHTKTGLKYFGKTISKNPEKYRGSGIRWQNHLKEHGGNRSDVTTEIIGYYTDETECRKDALEFSEKHNIVESNDWANLEPEDGTWGGCGGNAGPRNGSYGTRWITNGNENRKILKNDQVPDGWRYGMSVPNDWGARLSKTQKGQTSPLKGKTWDDIYGKEKADLMRENLSHQRKGKPCGRNKR